MNELSQIRDELTKIITFFDKNRQPKEKNRNIGKLKWITPDDYNKMSSLVISKNIAGIKAAIKKYGDIMNKKIEKKENIINRKKKIEEIKKIRDQIKSFLNDKNFILTIDKTFIDRVNRMMSPGSTSKRYHLEAILKTLKNSRKIYDNVNPNRSTSDNLLNDFFNNYVKNYDNDKQIRIMGELDEFVRSMGGMVENIDPTMTNNIINQIREREEGIKEPILYNQQTKENEKINISTKENEEKKRRDEKISNAVNEYISQIESGNYEYPLLYGMIQVLANEASGYPYNENSEYLLNLIRERMDRDVINGIITPKDRRDSLDLLDTFNRYVNRDNIPNYNEYDEHFRFRRHDPIHVNIGRKLVGEVAKLTKGPTIAQSLGLSRNSIDNIGKFAETFGHFVPTIAKFLIGAALTYGGVNFIDSIFNKNNLSGEEFIKLNQIKPFKINEDVEEIVKQTPPPLGEFGPPQGGIIPRTGPAIYLKPFISKEYILNKNRENYLRQRNLRQRNIRQNKI